MYGLFTHSWTFNANVLSSYLHCQDKAPPSLLLLISLSPLSTSLFKDYRLSSKDFKRHQQRVHIILVSRPINDLTNWNNRFAWLERITASGYKYIKDIIRERQEEKDSTAIS